MVTKEITEDHFISLFVDDTLVVALVDTGASKTLMSEDTAKTLELHVEPLNSGDLAMLFSADGNPLPIVGKVITNFNINGLKFTYTINIVHKLSHVLIIGCDMMQYTMQYTNAVVDFGRRKITFTEPSNDVFTTLLQRSVSQGERSTEMYARAAETACIPGYSEAIVPVVVAQRFNGSAILLEPNRNSLNPRFAVARSLSQCDRGRTYCRILNYQPGDLTLHKGYKLAKVESMSSINSCTLCTDNDIGLQGVSKKMESKNLQLRSKLDEFCNDYKFKINSNLTTEQKYQLLQLLWDNKDIFARNLGDLASYPGYQLNIELLSDRKVFKRQFRLSPADNFEAQRQIDLMEQYNIIEKTDNCDYNSPIFLVNKKNNTKRLVIDMRSLNAIIKPKLIQLPRITDLVEEAALRKAKYMTGIDLFSGYHNIMIDPKSRDYTSFTSPVTGQRYRYVKTPFGLSIAPAAMSLVINNVFKNALRRTVYAYLDDLLTLDQEFEGHLNSLREVFHQLRINKLRANPAKCTFAENKLEFLGYLISQNGIEISEDKFNIIRKIVPPKNVKGLQRLLGLFNYFKRQIKDYPQNTYHLRKLLQKNTPFFWSAECQNELNYLKSALLSRPILQPLNPGRDLILQCDGSIYGLGWVVYQKDDDNQLRVVCYGGHSTTPAQTRYHSSELELHALVLAVKSVEWLARCREVTVFTDSSRILHINKWEPVNNRQRRIILYLSQFRLDIRYIKGVKNLPADALSRIYCDMSQEERLKLIPKSESSGDFIVTVTDNTRCSEKSENFSDGPMQMNAVNQHTLNVTTRSMKTKLDQKRQSTETELNADTSNFVPEQSGTTYLSELQNFNGNSQHDENNMTESTRVTVAPEELQPQQQQGQQRDACMPTGEDVEPQTLPLIDDSDDEPSLDTQLSSLQGVTERTLKPMDYNNDQEFGPIYQFLVENKLTGDDKVDKKTLF